MIIRYSSTFGRCSQISRSANREVGFGDTQNEKGRGRGDKLEDRGQETRKEKHLIGCFTC